MSRGRSGWCGRCSVRAPVAVRLASYVGRGSGSPTWDVGPEVLRGTWVRKSYVGRGSGSPTWDVGPEVPRGTWVRKSHVGRGSGSPTWDVGPEVPREAVPKIEAPRGNYGEVSPEAAEQLISHGGRRGATSGKGVFRQL